MKGYRLGSNILTDFNDKLYCHVYEHSGSTMPVSYLSPQLDDQKTHTSYKKTLSKVTVLYTIILVFSER